jgi:hypothetical protein
MVNVIKEQNEFTKSNKKQSINRENTSEYTMATLIPKYFQNHHRLQFVSGIYTNKNASSIL